MSEDLRKTSRRTTGTWQNLENKILKYDIHPWVFFVGSGIIILGVALTLIAGDAASAAFSAMQSWIATYTGFFFVFVMNVVLVFCFFLLLRDSFN